MALIEDTIPLPPLLQLRSKTYLEDLYAGRHLSVREIADRLSLKVLRRVRNCCFLKVVIYCMMKIGYRDE